MAVTPRGSIAKRRIALKQWASADSAGKPPPDTGATGRMRARDLRLSEPNSGS
jgi:hypothetical protein